MRFSVSVLLLLFARNVLADGLMYIPKWKMVGDAACYDFDQAKTLMILDSRLQLCAAVEDAYPKEVSSLKLANVQLQLALDNADKNAKLWETQNGATKTDLVQCRTDLDKAQSTKSIGMGWALAGVVAAILGGVLLGVYVIKK
jgi:hypothetical protein